MRKPPFSLRQSLRAQLAVAAAVLVLCIVALSGIGIAIRIDHRDRTAVDEQLTVRAERVLKDLDRMLGPDGQNKVGPKAPPPRGDTYGDLLDGSESLVRIITNGEMQVQRGAIPVRDLPIPEGDGFSNVSVNAQPWRSLVLASATQAGTRLQVVQTLVPVNDRLASNERLVAMVTVLATLVAAVAGSLVGRLVLNPLARLASGAVKIAYDPDPGHRLPAMTSPAEVAALSTTLNGMLDRLGSNVEMTRRFNADVGHELRTPLSVLGTYLESMLTNPTLTADVRAASLSAMSAQHRRMVSLLDGLQTLARADAGALPVSAEIEVGTLVDECVRQAVRRHLDITYTFGDTSGDAVTAGWRDGLRLAIDNLLDNAALHGRCSGRVDVSVGLLAEHILVTVTDDGPGIPPEHRERVRARFARGERTRSRGSGLGLALVEQQVRLHGGALDLAESQPHGLVASITLRRS
ncbi:MAG TPA: HAMP domain-containing sensor histidine kinase [Kineosporiaceae bacterium]|nr:HAMP domain-containing sensor histidine kinase [Kineosporiaceae bacterium]